MAPEAGADVDVAAEADLDFIETCYLIRQGDEAGKLRTVDQIDRIADGESGGLMRKFFRGNE